MVLLSREDTAASEAAKARAAENAEAKAKQEAYEKSPEGRRDNLKKDIDTYSKQIDELTDELVELQQTEGLYPAGSDAETKRKNDLAQAQEELKAALRTKQELRARIKALENGNS